jgi:hypothetical protein
VCSIIGNKWILNTANLVITGDIGGEVTERGASGSEAPQFEMGVGTEHRAEAEAKEAWSFFKELEIWFRQPS